MHVPSNCRAPLSGAPDSGPDGTTHQNCFHTNRKHFTLAIRQNWWFCTPEICCIIRNSADDFPFKTLCVMIAPFVTHGSGYAPEWLVWIVNWIIWNSCLTSTAEMSIFYDLLLNIIPEWDRWINPYFSYTYDVRVHNRSNYEGWHTLCLYRFCSYSNGCNKNKGICQTRDRQLVATYFLLVWFPPVVILLHSSELYPWPRSVKARMKYWIRWWIIAWQARCMFSTRKKAGWIYSWTALSRDTSLQNPLWLTLWS